MIDRLIDELDAVLSRRAIDPLFQPIVEIATGDTVAYEALARGPVDGPLRMPQELFDTAREAGRLDELDELCRTRAVESAVEAGLRAPFGLFVNVEPAAIPAAPPAVPGLDVGLHLLERLLGAAIALEVEALFEHERRGTTWRAPGDRAANRAGVPA